jgi:hypothetical protein
MSYFTLISAAGMAYDLQDDLHVVVEGMQGIGVPEPTNTAIAYPIMDGQIPQSQLYTKRDITLTCTISGTSIATIHARRRALQAVINRDATPTWKPMHLRYSGSGTTYEVEVYYAGGLDVLDIKLWKERFSLKFISFDPYWYAISDSTAALATSATLANANYILKKSAAGVWSALGTGFNGEVFAIAVDPMTGYVWAGGSFTTANGATARGIAFWNGSTWAEPAGGVNGTVKAIAIGGGYVYAGGNFPFDGPGSYDLNGIVRYTPDGVSRSALGGGVGVGYDAGYDGVRALAILPDGSLFVGGWFPWVFQPGGSNPAYVNIAKWNGSSWESLGDANQPVLALGTTGFNEVFAGGIFTTIGGVSVTRLARWNGSAWTAVGSGVDDAPYSMVIGKDHNVYVGGAYITADGSSALRVARWNGVGLYPLGAGIGPSTNDGLATVRSLAVQDDGTLYAGAVSVTYAGDLLLPSPLVKWNGSIFIPEDVVLPGTPAVRGLAVDSSGNLYIGFSTGGSATIPGRTTVTNGGSARAYPTLTVAITGGAMRVRGLVNNTTGKTIYMNYVMYSGETLTITLTPGNRSVRSSLYGDVSGFMLPSSDYAVWSLMPGANDVALLLQTVSGSPTVSACTLAWRNRYWGAD